MKSTQIAVIALALFATGAAQAGGGLKARLKGAHEVPPVESEAIGQAMFKVNDDLTVMRFTLQIRNGLGLLGAGGAHLHCAPEGLNGPVIAWLAGEAAPGFQGRLRITAYMTDDNVIANDTCGSSVAELVEAMLDGNVYVNVHSVANPGGEIRGQVRRGQGNDKKDDEPDP